MQYLNLKIYMLVFLWPVFDCMKKPNFEHKFVKYVHDIYWMNFQKSNKLWGSTSNTHHISILLYYTDRIKHFFYASINNKQRLHNIKITYITMVYNLIFKKDNLKPWQIVLRQEKKRRCVLKIELVILKI